jgi:hypothetical protein
MEGVDVALPFVLGACWRQTRTKACCIVLGDAMSRGSHPTAPELGESSGGREWWQGSAFPKRGCLGPLLVPDSGRSIRRTGVNTYQSAHPRRYWCDIIASSALVEVLLDYISRFPHNFLIF